ncbi:uncharacterized protein KY384_006892 [Bacidia gigantensis]|uniref:uncharacterized protein n=1 Tax=Bacidia gigantensis TaxID=2732470 RepID=UPI001D045037|nr:uncharacterized protein KY384_006892 [Bacidia gigantensis]KAG8527976.1 hypothetical protein KY384_006892 [Bacidia gigantensis]
MAKKPKLLSHDEIWDDSGIVESWNEALEEYKVLYMIQSLVHYADDVKLYHSIHAKGERVEDVIEHFKAHEDLDNELLEDNLTTSVNGAEQSLATDEVVEDGVWEQEQEEMQDDEHITHNLMMSWYWAGYYTGYQQGQQQSLAQQADKR